MGRTPTKRKCPFFFSALDIKERGQKTDKSSSKKKRTFIFFKEKSNSKR
jgi:hypothetical protein